MKRRFNEFYVIPESWGIVGIVLFGLIFLKKSVNEQQEAKRNEILNHERIHVRQWAETLFVIFPIWYLIEYLIRFIQYRNWDQAYRNISFEREAYSHERDRAYLFKRGLWSFVRYL